MRSSFLSQASFPSKILFSFFVVCISSLVFFLLGRIVAGPLFGLTMQEVDAALKYDDSSNIVVLKYFQFIQSFSLFVIPSLIVVWAFSPKWTNYLRLRNKPSTILVFMIILIMLIILPVVNFLSDLNSSISFPDFMKEFEDSLHNMQENVKSLMDDFLSVKTDGGFLFNILLIAVLPAIGEEFFFRGLLQKLFSGWLKNEHWGIFISAFLFSAFHLQLFDFFPIMLFGVFFGYLLMWSKNLWLPIIAHFINNAFAVSYYYFANPAKTKNIDDFGTLPGTRIYAFFSLIIVGFLIYLIYRIERRRQDNNLLEV